MRTRTIVQVDRTHVGKETEVRQALEKIGAEVETSPDGKGFIVAHADQDVLRRVGELQSVRTMSADPTY